MRNITSFQILSAFLLFSFTGRAQILFDGFQQKAKTGSISLSYTYQSADVFMAGTSPLYYVRNFHIQSLYTTYGITRNLSLAASLPRIGGMLQDGLFGIRYMPWQGILKNARVLSYVSLDYGHPLSDYETEIGQAIGQQARRIGSTAILQYQHNAGYFGSLSLQYDYKFDPVPSTYGYRVRAGFFNGKQYGHIQVKQGFNVGGKDYRGTGELMAENFRVLGPEFLELGISLFQTLPKGFGISGSIAKTLKGRNVGLASTISAGLTYSWP